MEVKFYEIGEIDDSLLRYAVIASRYLGKWIYCKNKKRLKWEVPGGRREPDEAIFDTAKRELFEETGAVKFDIQPVCVYSVTTEDESFGMLYYAEITELGGLPETEIEQIDFFQDIPDELSFPLIQPKLIKKVKSTFRIIDIRLEEPKDYRTVEELTRAAFDNPENLKLSQADYPMEHYLVHMLRERDGIMALNFVAEIDGKIVGHIIYGNAHILKPDESKAGVLNFGPLSVWPEFQRTGIGSALMRYSIAAAKKLGYGAILIFGHPEYYPRFGFKEAKEFGITDRNGKNQPAFMAMELIEGYLSDKSGRFIDSDLYSDDFLREPAKEFDKQFHTNL